MPRPNLFVVGAPKAGTTTLTRWLSTHPDVYMSVPKEPSYWASDFPDVRIKRGYPTPETYAGLYDSERAQQAQVRVDGSTLYLYSRTAIADIAAAGPAKFVVALRNPVDLLVSYHRTQLVVLNETETDFGTAWRRSLSGIGPDTVPLDPKLVDYPMIGALGAAVERLLTLVDPADVHFVWLDDLAANPESTWNQLTDFAGLTRTELAAAELHNPSTKTYRFRSVRRLTHRPPVALAGPTRRLRQWSRTTDSAVVARLKRTLWRPAPRPTASAEIRAQVADYLKADIALLGDLLGRDLSSWQAG